MRQQVVAVVVVGYLDRPKGRAKPRVAAAAVDWHPNLSQVSQSTLLRLAEGMRFVVAG